MPFEKKNYILKKQKKTFFKRKAKIEILKIYCHIIIFLISNDEQERLK